MTDVSQSLKDRTVLFCGPIENPLNSGRYMMAGMEQLSLRVIGYDYRTHAAHEVDLMRICDRERPDYVFILKGEKLSPEMIRLFKQKGSIIILWITTSQMESWMIPLVQAVDFIVTNVEEQVEFFGKHGAKHSVWIHQGFAKEFFGISDEERTPDGKLFADLAMIGSMGHPIYTTRCKLVMLLKRQGFDIKWWGPRLSRQLRNLPYFLGGVHRVWGGKEVYMQNFADVVRHTRIFIGQDADLPVTGRYLSNRIFAVAGCGGFYLGRRTAGIEEIFTVDREVVVFDSDDEMLEKARFYLTHEDARRRIARAGQRRVLTEYTYKNQMEKIFRWVQKYL